MPQRRREQLGYDADNANEAMNTAIDQLMAEGWSAGAAAYEAAATLEGAGETATVNSIQTCTELGGIPVPGLTGTDSVTCRLDEHSKTQSRRLLAANLGFDAAAIFILKHDGADGYRRMYSEKKLRSSARRAELDDSLPLEQLIMKMRERFGITDETPE